MANILDKAIGFFSPSAGFKRTQNRARMLQMENQVRKYEGAAEGRRHNGWLMRNNPSVNLLINKDLKNLVARSRELSINNPYAKKAPYSIANNVVGTGIIPTPAISDRIENGKVKPIEGKEKFLEIVKIAWKDWAEKLSCDYNGDYSFYGLQYLVMKTVIVSGEVLAIRKPVKTDVNKYGFQILILEGDYIDTTKKTEKDDDGGYTFYGIKYDSRSKRKGYWIYDRHPSEGNAQSTLVNIDDIIHVYDVERAGQNRGVPSAASTILKQRDLDDYEDAELLGKKAAACMPIFVTNQDPDAKDENDQIESIEPGAINYLNGGEQVTFATPPANNGFSEFTKTQHRGIANGYLMTYEMLTGDLSNVNFSSGRMGAQEFAKQVESWQYLMLIPKFCDKAFNWFAKSLTIGAGLPADIEVLASWTAPRRTMIDPVKETNAQRTAMRSGLVSWSETVRQAGYNPDEVLKELTDDQKKFKDAGLMNDWTPLFELTAKQNGADTSKKGKQVQE
jgi:lambda family phage portal protein